MIFLSCLQQPLIHFFFPNTTTLPKLVIGSRVNSVAIIWSSHFTLYGGVITVFNRRRALPYFFLYLQLFTTFSKTKTK